MNRRLLLLAPCLLLILNYPWLAIFSQQSFLFGMPLLHLYLFVLWFVIILTVMFLLGGKDEEDHAGARRALRGDDQQVSVGPERRRANESHDATK